LDLVVVVHDESERPHTHPTLDTHSRLWTAPANDGQMTAVTVCHGGGDLSTSSICIWQQRVAGCFSCV